MGPCPPGMECCHNNGNRTDNRVENLRWDTRRANMQDKREHGRFPRGEATGRSKLSDAEALQILTHRGWLTQAHLGSVFGVDRSTVALIHSGKNWSHLQVSP